MAVMDKLLRAARTWRGSLSHPKSMIPSHPRAPELRHCFLHHGNFKLSNDIEPFYQDELALYRQCAEKRDKVLRVRLQESEYKLGSSIPIDLAKKRITQLETGATSLERHLILASGAEGIEGLRRRWSLHGRMTDTKKRLESLKQGMENRKKDEHDQPPKVKPSTQKRWFFW